MWKNKFSSQDLQDICIESGGQVNKDEVVCTLAVLFLSLQKEHVRVDGPFLHILLSSLQTNSTVEGKVKVWNSKCTKVFKR